VGCINKPNERDDRMLEESANGRNCEPAQEILEEHEHIENPSPQEEAERLREIDDKIQEAIENGKDLNDQDIRSEIKRLTPSAAQSFINEIKDDQPITYLPDPSELSKEEMEKLKEIISEERPDRVLIVGHTNMFESNIKVIEGVPPIIHYHIPVTTVENLKAMLCKNAPVDGNDEYFNLHHWRREARGPLFIMKKSTHQKLSGLLHKYEPSERVSESKRKIQRKKFWEWWAKEYLGPWAKEFEGME